MLLRIKSGAASLLLLWSSAGSVATVSWPAEGFLFVCRVRSTLLIYESTLGKKRCHDLIRLDDRDPSAGTRRD